MGTRDGDLPYFTHGKRVTLNTFDDVVDHLRAEIQTISKMNKLNVTTYILRHIPCNTGVVAHTYHIDIFM